MCPLCGSVEECVHDAEEEDNEGRAVEVEAVPRAIERSASSKIFHGSQENTECCDMVANAAIAPHTEVFNVYNDRLTNAQLLAHYGFILDSNENDVIAWELRSLCLEVPSLISGLRFENNEEVNARRSEISDIGENERIFGDPRGSVGIGSGGNVHEMFGGAVGTDLSAKETVVDRRLEVRENDLNGTTQSFLARLLEVVAAWPHSGGIWKSSLLVYDPTDDAGGRIPELQAVSPSDGSLDGVTRAQGHFKPDPTSDLFSSSRNEAANVQSQSDLSGEALGSGLHHESMNVSVLTVWRCCGGRNF